MGREGEHLCPGMLGVAVPANSPQVDCEKLVGIANYSLVSGHRVTSAMTVSSHTQWQPEQLTTGMGSVTHIHIQIKGFVTP